MSGPGLILALAFVNPALLAGLGLAAVPVIIHWLSRRRYRRVPWAALRFLRDAEQESRRRRKLEEWLLLALRCLALALLALLVARPYVRPGGLAALLGGPDPVDRVLVLDDSASLAYRAGTAMDFERLKTTAGRLLDWLRQEAPRDPVSLHLTSLEEPLVRREVLTDALLAEVRERLAAREPAPVPARPQHVFQELADELAASPRRAVVYVLSDFQRTDWLTGSEKGGVFAPLQRVLADADRGTEPPVRVVLLASGSEPRDNLALVDVALDRPQTVAGQPAVVRAHLANYGHRPLADVTLQVEIDTVPLPAVPAGTIAPGDTTEVALELTFPDEGYRELALSAGPVDAFRLDDARRRALRVLPAVSVLAVNGSPAADPRADEVFLLRNALAPAGPLSSGVRVEALDPERLAGADLASYDVVFLCNVPAPDAAARQGLEHFVREGGGLAIFLGDAIPDVTDYNRVLFADGDGLLPLALERREPPAGRTTPVGLVRTEPHPVTAMFPAAGEGLSEHVHFWTYYRSLEPPTPTASTQVGQPPAADPQPKAAALRRPPAVVLARFTDPDGSPALVERAFGDGRVLLFTSSVDLDWNDWARAVDGSYVVTLLEMVQYLARRDSHPAQFVAGEPLRLRLSPDQYEPIATFRAPGADAAAQEGRVVEEPGAGPGLVLAGPRAMELGAYQVELVGRDGQTQVRPLCVNLAPSESDLAAASAAELAAALPGIPHEYVRAGEDSLAGGGPARRELWPAVLILLVTILLLEQALACYFGLPRMAARPGWLPQRPQPVSYARVRGTPNDPGAEVARVAQEQATR